MASIPDGPLFQDFTSLREAKSIKATTSQSEVKEKSFLEVMDNEAAIKP